MKLINLINKKIINLISATVRKDIGYILKKLNYDILSKISVVKIYCEVKKFKGKKT